MTDLSWMGQARCVGYDPEIWFPGSGRLKGVSKAKGICYHCPVFLDCRIYSLTIRMNHGPNVLHGIWAGLTKRDRANSSVAKRLLSEAKNDLVQREGSYG